MYNVGEGLQSWSLRYPSLFKPEQEDSVPYDTNVSTSRRGQMIAKHCWLVSMIQVNHLKPST